MTTIHASPSYRIRAATPPPPGYPTQPTPDVYTAEPDAAGFEARRAAFLAHCLANPAPENTKIVSYELARLAAGGTVHEAAIQAALDFIDARRDCADFALHGVLRLLYQFGDHPGLSRDLVARCRQTVLRFKYWPDEPGADSLCTWTENHHILFASAGYLAGQMFPDAAFTNSGHTGAEKIALCGPRIRRWLDLRFRTGFSEWLSHVYYDEDLTALLSLADFCRDTEIGGRAAMVTDLLLLDVALNSFRGVFGSSHGRAYENTKKWASNEGTTDIAKLLFGMGQYSGFDNMSAVAFALSPNYRMPPAIAAIAGDLGRGIMENRQRMGIRLAEAARWGLGAESFEDGMTYLTLEAYLHPRTVGLVMRMFDAFGWWDNAFFAPFKPYRRLLGLLRRTGTLRLLARALEWDLCRNTREEVNVLTYRTPDTMLSCAQDYRPGYGGDQQHIWQATLGPDAVCFTTHPARLSGPSPNYWAGSGVLPRAAQAGNVVIAIYRIHRRPALYVRGRLAFTHAWLPRDQFDEVVERDGWIFAAKGDGYLALRSQRPYRWQEKPGEDQGREIIAEGDSNIWLCELGRRATDGEFGAFIARICRAPVHYDRLSVTYNSPSQGKLAFGWRGPLRRDGPVVPLHGYGRYENPYVRADFPAERVAVRAGGHALELDWKQMSRQWEGLL
ncbi:MAG: hypothetical protein NT169_24840 [Chloroflexi bacterium]|nr:hypothetical protein [Chloroflexota bacterium]